MRIQPHQREEHVGDRRVVDATGTAWVCGGCGEWEIGLDELAAYERRAALAVLRGGWSVPGPAFRYARKALGVRREALGELLDVSADEVARYEAGDAHAPRASCLALALLLDEALRGETPASLLAKARAPAPTELRIAAR